MNAEIFTCVGCGLKGPELEVQSCGHVYCRRCLALNLNGKLVCYLKHHSPQVNEETGSHAKNEQVSCCFCKSIHDLGDIKSHYDVCEMHPVKCKYCNESCIRSEIKKHVQECSNNSRLCRFSAVGCHFQGNKTEIEKHETEKNHLELMMNFSLNFQKELSRQMSVIKEQQNEEMLKSERNMTSLITANSQLADAMNEKSDAVDLKVNELKRKDDDQTEKIDQLTKCCSENSTQGEKLEQLYKEQKQELADFKANDSTFVYIWKIENFRTCQENAKISGSELIYSDPFYTNKHGYKMRMMLYPNGIAAGKDTHLSIYLQVMRGPYDAILKWPIVYSANISILGQLNNKNNKNLPFKSDSNKSARPFAMPLKECNIGWGFPMFISLDKLEASYMVDDTIFIELKLNVTC